MDIVRIGAAVVVGASVVVGANVVVVVVGANVVVVGTSVVVGANVVVVGTSVVVVGATVVVVVVVGAAVVVVVVVTCAYAGRIPLFGKIAEAANRPLATSVLRTKRRRLSGVLSCSSLKSSSFLDGFEPSSRFFVVIFMPLCKGTEI
jgi:hypothetical protein